MGGAALIVPFELRHVLPCSSRQVECFAIGQLLQTAYCNLSRVRTPENGVEDPCEFKDPPWN